MPVAAAFPTLVTPLLDHEDFLTTFKRRSLHPCPGVPAHRCSGKPGPMAFCLCFCSASRRMPLPPWPSASLKQQVTCWLPLDRGTDTSVVISVQSMDVSRARPAGLRPGSALESSSLCTQLRLSSAAEVPSGLVPRKSQGMRTVEGGEGLLALQRVWIRGAR